MGADKVTEALVDALKQARAGAAEQRLFKSGKLDGLFPGRGGVNGEAATLAVRDGLLEVVRTETKGKTAIEWVRLTPRGVDFLHGHESPARAVAELRAALYTVREGLPAWQAEMRQELDDLAARLAEDSQRIMQRLEALGQRVEEALRCLEEARPELPDDLAATVPWAAAALTYLDHRRHGGTGDCPLPELFAALAAMHPELSVTAFHDGLRRLHDAKVLRLLPLNGPAEELTQPEFALLDRSAVLYYVAR